MNKLLAAVLATLVVSAAFAQKVPKSDATTPAAPKTAPASAPAPAPAPVAAPAKPAPVGSGTKAPKAQ